MIIRQELISIVQLPRIKISGLQFLVSQIESVDLHKLANKDQFDSLRKKVTY